MNNQRAKMQRAWQKYQQKIRNIRKKRNEILRKEDQRYTDKKLKQIREALNL